METSFGDWEDGVVEIVKTAKRDVYCYVLIEDGRMVAVNKSVPK